MIHFVDRNGADSVLNFNKGNVGIPLITNIECTIYYNTVYRLIITFDVSLYKSMTIRNKVVDLTNLSTYKETLFNTNGKDAISLNTGNLITNLVLL